MSEEKKETGLVRRGQGSTLANRDWTLMPSSLGEAREIAVMIANSEFAPKDYKGKPESVIIAMQMGADLGLKPMQALQNIAVINGRPSIWGDGALALAMPALESFKEWIDGVADLRVAHCELRRKGWPDSVHRTFSVDDAKKAGLWSKDGPWQKYPQRMLAMRARSWALRDGCADLLMGLVLAEEASDYPDAIDAQAVHVPEGTAPDLMEKVPEGMRENVEKAFATLNFSAAQRFTKLNEFLGGADAVPEEGATALLEWCKDEYSKRKTGQPRAASRHNGNAKRPTQAEAQTAAELTHGEHQAGAPVVDAEVVEAKPSEAAASENNQRSNREGEWF